MKGLIEQPRDLMSRLRQSIDWVVVVLAFAVIALAVINLNSAGKGDWSGRVATQLRWTHPRSLGYLVANTLGAGVLAWLAWTSRDWGFLLLEGVWSAVSAVGLISVLRAHRLPDATPTP